MITLKIENTRSCKLTKNEEVWKGDNNISAFSIVFPSNFGAGHPRAECAVEMRCYLPNGEFLSYELDTSQPIATQPITYDLTEQEQQIGIMFIITHGAEVIGKTNSETLYVYDAPDSDREPLTPREDFDRVINEQRQTIASQAATIDEQSNTIGSQGEQITELNGEVSTLEGTVAEQQATITRQNTTIDELNRRVPPLQTLDPINPSQTQQTYTPESPNIGFPQVIVNAPTAEGLRFDYGNLKKDVEFLDGVGTYAPIYGTTSQGIYCFLNDDGLSSTLDIKLNGRFGSFWDCRGFFSNSAVVTKLHFFSDIVSFEKNAYQDCNGLLELTLPQSLRTLKNNNFMQISSLRKLILPHGLEATAYQNFYYAQLLEELWLPNTLAFVNANTFTDIPELKYVTLENGFNCSISFLSRSTLYSVETIVSWLEALADRTGQTAYTLTIGATNLNKLTAEQKAIAIGKNWNLA